MIESVLIQMIEGKVVSFQGKDAAIIYEQMQNPWLPFLTLERGKRITYIPLQNILYIDFTKQDDEEEMKQRIDEIWNQIFASIDLDEISTSSREIEFYVDEDITYGRVGDGEWQRVSQEQQVANWLFEIDELE